MYEKDYKNLYLKYKVKYNKLKNMTGGAAYDLAKLIENRDNYTTADLPQDLIKKGYFINSKEGIKLGNAYRTMIMAQTEFSLRNETFLESINDDANENFTRASRTPELSIDSAGKPLILVFENDWGLVGEVLTFSFGKKFAILNMANAIAFGGGYSHGSKAQEENMFRRTTAVLHNEGTELVRTKDKIVLKYTPKKTELINGLTGRVELNEGICFRDIEDHKYDFLPRKRIFPFFELRSAAEEIKFSVEDKKNESLFRIAIADQDFIDLLHEKYNGMDDTAIYEVVFNSSIPIDTDINQKCIVLFGEGNIGMFRDIIYYTIPYYLDLKKKITAQLETLKRNKIRHVVLSAFGCGAFRNPPHVVAECYKRVIGKYESDFDVIAFAIIGKDNYSAFRGILMPSEPQNFDTLNGKVSTLSTSRVDVFIPDLSALERPYPPPGSVLKQPEITWQRIDKKSGEIIDIGHDISSLINRLSEKQIMTGDGKNITFNFVEATCVIGGGGLAAGKECKIHITRDHKWEYKDSDRWELFSLKYGKDIDGLINTACQIEYDGKQYRFLSAKLLSVDEFSSNPEVIPLKKKINISPAPPGLSLSTTLLRPSDVKESVFSWGASTKPVVQKQDICVKPEYQKLANLLAKYDIKQMIINDIKNKTKEKHWIWWIFPLDRPGQNDTKHRIFLPQEQIPCLFKDRNWNEIISALYDKFKSKEVRWQNYFPERDHWRINYFMRDYAYDFIIKETSGPITDFVSVYYN